MPSSASIRMPSASGVGNGFFLQAVTTSTARPHPASASPPRIGNPARHERCRQEGRSRQTRQAAMTDGLPSSVDVLPHTRLLQMNNLHSSCSAVLEAAAHEKKIEKAKDQKTEDKIGPSRS